MKSIENAVQISGQNAIGIAFSKPDMDRIQDRIVHAILSYYV